MCVLAGGGGGGGGGTVCGNVSIVLMSVVLVY